MAILSDFFKKLLSKFMKDIQLSIDSNFEKGSIRVFDMADRRDLKPIKPTKQEKEMLSGQIFDNIKGVTDDMNKQIKNAIRNSILERESNKETAQRLNEIFKGKASKSRLKMIAVTETSRILNTSSMKTARRLGAIGKYLGKGGPNPWPDSLLLLEKYGSPEKAIPMDEPFTITYKGKTQVFQFPPGRPNDSELVHFIFEKPSKEED